MTPRRFLPALLLLFVGSGCAALDLRNRLVSAAAARDRLVGRLAGRAARHVHGRHVPGQPAAAALRLAAGSTRCASTPCSSSASASSACWCCSACRWSAGVYTAWAGHRHRRASCVRGVAAAICLLPPTLLMGATLPAIVALGRDDAATACRGSASSTAATSPAPSSAACWPASTCCACTTWRSPPTSPSR